MPDPKQSSNKNKFMSTCVPQVIKEGKKQDQAIAICLAKWAKRNKDEQDKFKIFSEDRSNIINKR